MGPCCLRAPQTCQLSILNTGDTVVPFDYAFALHKGFPIEDVWAISAGILNAQVLGAVSAMVLQLFLSWLCL